jgi:hypothetical protein
MAAGCRPAPVRPTLPATLPEPQRLLDILAEQRREVTSVRGFAEIAYESGEEKVGARHAVLARRPDHFRIEALSFFGALAVVTSDGSDMVLYVRRENKVFRGPASPGSVAAYAGVPVPVPDVVAILLGTPPERRPTGAATVTRDDERALIVLELPLEAERQEIWFAPDTLLSVASVTALPDGRRLQVRFGDYRDHGGVRFPHSIDMWAEPGDRTVRVRYAEPSLNTDMADGLFVFPRRAGVEEFGIEQYLPQGWSP